MNAPIDISNIRLETPRLILRPWRESDLEDLYEYACVPGVGEMAGWLHHESVETSKMILDSFIAHKKTLALELKETGKVIGSLGIEKVKEEPEIPTELQGRELGYVLSKDYWGRGLMPEAVKAVIDYCFDTLRYNYLTCAHFLRNGRSCRVIEKCGFQYVKDVIHTTRYETMEEAKLYVLYRLNKE